MELSNKLFDPIYVDQVISQMDYLEEYLSRSNIVESDIYKSLGGQFALVRVFRYGQNRVLLVSKYGQIEDY